MSLCQLGSVYLSRLPRVVFRVKEEKRKRSEKGEHMKKCRRDSAPFAYGAACASLCLSPSQLFVHRESLAFVNAE